MISIGLPAILPPRCSLASSTERRMSSPIAACGPEKVLMKPILTLCCASAGAALSAMAAIVAVPNNLPIITPLPVSVGVYRSRKHSAAQFEALDLAGGGLGQFRHVLDPTRIFVGRQRLFAERHQFLGQFLVAATGLFQHDECFGFEQAVLVGVADDGRFQYGGMADEAVLDLDRRAPDAAHLQHVVAAAVVDEVTVFVLAIGVAGVEPAIDHGLGGLLRVVPVVLGGPPRAKPQASALAFAHRLAVLVDDL